jgi:alkylated DNA nucleotide flippase Atl1
VDQPDAPDEADGQELTELASAVLDVVDLVPPGRVMTYGDVAEYLGRGGPRTVGNVMARYGGAVAWWRVLRADGSPPAGHERRALERYRAEGTPLRAGGTRVDLARARWDGVVKNVRQGMDRST